MNNEREVPVYLFTGILESGKTSFIRDTLNDRGFQRGEKTVLILCEEGIEEYDEVALSKKNVFIERRHRLAMRRQKDLKVCWQKKNYRLISMRILLK